MRGRDALCKNRLKELQVAAMSYAINGGNLPPAKSYWAKGDVNWYVRVGWLDWVGAGAPKPIKDPAPAKGKTKWWGPDGLTSINNGALWEYVGSVKSYACPEWQQPGVCGKFSPEGQIFKFDGTDNFPWRCYVMNSRVSGSNIGNIEASKMLLFTEYSNTNNYNGDQIAERNMMGEGSGADAPEWDGSFDCDVQSGKNYPLENVGLYHSGRANAVFVDGHIESLTWNVTTNAAYGNW